MSQDSYIPYKSMMNDALIGVMSDALNQAQCHGMQGDHHFYIGVHMTHKDLQASDKLKQRYPEKMTIVLQHQFWDLKVEKDHFCVSLSFDNVVEKLTIPFRAVEFFADPSAQVRFDFEVSSDPFDRKQIEYKIDDQNADPAVDDNKVVSIDQFRKK